MSGGGPLAFPLALNTSTTTTTTTTPLKGVLYPTVAFEFFATTYEAVRFFLGPRNLGRFSTSRWVARLVPHSFGGISYPGISLDPAIATSAHTVDCSAIAAPNTRCGWHSK